MGRGITAIEIGWIAGILEGEGCFYYNSSPSIVVVMTDEDTIAKFAKIIGRPYTIKGVGGGYKMNYCAAIYGSPAIAWMFTIYSLMSKRRQAKILETINKWKGIPVRDKENFSCGHSRFRNGVIGRHEIPNCYICSAERNRVSRRLKRLSNG